jgi:hypothetical protein
MSSQTIAYWSLLDVLCEGACGGTGFRRVAPGDPANSMLYIKVSATTQMCGVQMPADDSLAYKTTGEPSFSGSALSPTLQQLIYSWIKEGAQNN